MIQLLSTTVALFTNAIRNRVDVEIQLRKRGGNRTPSSSYSILKSLLIFLYILKQIIYLNSDAELKITSKNGPSFTDSFISITFTLTRVALQKNIFSLFCMNKSDITISVRFAQTFPCFRFTLQAGGRVWLHTGYILLSVCKENRQTNNYCDQQKKKKKKKKKIFYYPNL